jgi:hypothetical protein
MLATFSVKPGSQSWLSPQEDTMPTANDMRWFKTNFQDKINAALSGTPFTLDLMTALACQETGEVWPILRKTSLSVERILELCVGDTLDAPNRSAFPKNKAALLAVPRGDEMFNIARQALVEMAQFIDSYKGAASNPNKFCHGYGIFQFDLQFFKVEPDYFLEKRYADFDECLGKALQELQSARKKIGLQNKPTLSDLELAHIAIAYNTGGFIPAKGLKQGFRPPGGKFYGEQIFDFIQLAKTVTADGEPGTTSAPTGLLKVTASSLNLRSEALIDPNNPQGNVKEKLPKGQKVRPVTGQPVNGFLEVETELGGETVRGFASAQFLAPA